MMLNDMMQNFEKLEVWQQARILVNDIYAITREFPEEERYGLTLQLRRAAISISSNIAEGAGRVSPKDQKHFFTMAFGSIYEVLSQIILSFDLGFINEDILQKIRTQIKTISGQLACLSSYIDKKINNSTPKP